MKKFIAIILFTGSLFATADNIYYDKQLKQCFKIYNNEDIERLLANPEREK